MKHVYCTYIFRKRANDCPPPPPLSSHRVVRHSCCLKVRESLHVRASATHGQLPSNVSHVDSGRSVDDRANALLPRLDHMGRG